MDLYIENGVLCPSDKEDKEVLPKAVAIGRFAEGGLTLDDLRSKTPELLDAPLSYEESMCAIDGLRVATKGFNFAVNSFVASDVAKEWGVSTDTAGKYLAEIARIGLIQSATSVGC